MSESTRFWRTLLLLALTLVLAPVSFLLPPHLLWPLIVLGVGLAAGLGVVWIVLQAVPEWRRPAAVPVSPEGEPTSRARSPRSR